MDQGEEEEEEEEEQNVDYDPHTELQQRRAELDNRLKSTFESIFTKYERDFDGIGDEIDLATGEIVVNNGHLIEMMDERDAGLRKVRRGLIEDSDEDQGSSLEEDESLENGEEESDDDGEEVDEGDMEEEEEDGDEETATTGESMDDDDLILRGFTEANRFLQVSPELGLPSKTYARPPVPHRTKHTDALPSHSDILAQFGPKLGPQILGYITQQERARENQVEAAWRVPDIPIAAPRKRPIQAPFVRPREIERSISPEASTSIWAAAGTRVRQKKNGPSGLTLSESAQPKRIRNNFTAEEDEAMLEYVAKARKTGTGLFSALLWKGLAAKVTFPFTGYCQNLTHIVSTHDIRTEHGKTDTGTNSTSLLIRMCRYLKRTTLI